MQLDIHSLLGLVDQLKEGLEHVLEVQGAVWGQRHDVAGKARLGIEEGGPPAGVAKGRVVKHVLGLVCEEPVLEELIHDPRGTTEAVLHDVQEVTLLPVILQQGIDAVAVDPEVEGRALVQELLKLGQPKQVQLGDTQQAHSIPLLPAGPSSRPHGPGSM